MPPKLCCCNDAPLCILSQDNFDRPNANPPSGNWKVVDGEWEIVGEQLHSITPGPILTTVRQGPPIAPGVGYHTRFQVNLMGYTGSGGEWGVITAYTDEDNFKWVKLEFDGADLWPTFYNRAGGADTVVADRTTHPGGFPFNPTPGGPISVIFCNSDAEWVVRWNEIYWSMCDGGLDALPADTSVGCVGFLFGEFDSWADFRYHWESYRTCEVCQCFCIHDDFDYKCMPNQICIEVIPNEYYPCPEMDGRTAILVKNRIFTTDLSPETDLWFSDPFTIATIQYWWILSCNAGRVQLQWKLYPSEPDEDSIFADVVPSSCNPFSAVFPGLSISNRPCDILDEFGNPVSTGQKPIFCPSGECISGTVDVSWTVNAFACGGSGNAYWFLGPEEGGFGTLNLISELGI